MRLSTSSSDLERLWARYAARCDRAAANSQAYSQRVQAGILQAAGALRGDDRTAHKVMGRIFRGGPEKYGLRRMPDVEVVRQVLRNTPADSESRSAQLTAPST